MIALVDYGLGNIQAFANIYKRLNIPVVVAGTVGQLAAAERIILPGVGAFDWAMARLQESGMRDCLDDLVLNKKRPVLGVCVGMQMMACRSDEGKMAGLGWIEGEVKKLGGGEDEKVRGAEDERLNGRKLSLPHMGWNDVTPTDPGGFFNGISAARFYFLHSYYFAPASPDAILAMTDYNGPFASAVRVGNVYGTQFHPEKSHQWGIQLLKNFANL
jgi:glutamine amidotransferase